MWSDWPNPEVTSPHYTARPYVRFDDTLWSDPADTAGHAIEHSVTSSRRSPPMGTDERR